jgi:hypothetical protein
MRRKRLLATCIAAILAMLAGIAIFWYSTDEAPLKESDPSKVSTVEETTESETDLVTPTKEDLDELTERLASQNEDIFLDAWVPAVAESFKQEILSLMPPEGSTVIVNSEPSWSDDHDYWTIGMTIEAPNHEPVERAMVLEYIEGRLYVLKDEAVE